MELHNIETNTPKCGMCNYVSYAYSLILLGDVVLTTAYLINCMPSSIQCQLLVIIDKVKLNVIKKNQTPNR